jgi:hypothetical protein
VADDVTEVDTDDGEEGGMDDYEGVDRGYYVPLVRKWLEHFSDGSPVTDELVEEYINACDDADVPHGDMLWYPDSFGAGFDLLPLNRKELDEQTERCEECEDVRVQVSSGAKVAFLYCKCHSFGAMFIGEEYVAEEPPAPVEQSPAPGAPAPVEQSPAPGAASAAAARLTAGDVVDFFKPFDECLRRMETRHYSTLCRIWKIGCSSFYSAEEWELVDAEGCRNAIYTTMVRRSTRGTVPSYPIMFWETRSLPLPRSVEEFHEVTNRCKACYYQRRQWSGPGRDVTAHFCYAHAFGACIAGLPFDYQPEAI